MGEFITSHATSTPKLATRIEENTPSSPRRLGLSEDRPEPHSNHQSSGTHQPETQTPYPRVRAFPYDWSLLRLVSALLAEIIEERGIGKLHLKMASMNPPAN